MPTCKIGFVTLNTITEVDESWAIPNSKTNQQESTASAVYLNRTVKVPSTHNRGQNIPLTGIVDSENGQTSY